MIPQPLLRIFFPTSEQIYHQALVTEIVMIVKPDPKDPKVDTFLFSADVSQIGFVAQV